MSKVNMSAPQTYSRLFRPWDNTKLTQNKLNTGNPTEINNQKKLLISKNNFQEIYEKNMIEINHSTIILTQFPLSNAITDPLGIASITATTIPTPMEYYLEISNSTGLSPTQLANALGTLPSLQPLSQTSASATIHSKPSSPNSFSTVIDPLAISFMEQEYVRVMAEDAHLKALNARKQRPKKFKCPHCDVAFSNNGQLKGHIRIHTGERPFKCDLDTCGKTFTRNEELTRHKRIHTGLRPYECSNCGKKFGRRDHLKKHMKTHMPQERHLGSAIYVPVYPYLYGY